MGMLTIVGEAGRSDAGERLIRCLCECGSEGIYQAGNVACGHTKSCGCFARKVRRALVEDLPSVRRAREIGDLTGMRFGQLLVIGPDASKSARVGRWWRCACDCGGFAVALTANLLKGQRSCSDWSVHRPPPEIVGRFFGLWRVVRQATIDEYRSQPPIRAQKHRNPGRLIKGHLWLARCACGLERVMQTDQLHRSNSCRKCRPHVGASVAVVPRWGVVTRLFRPGLALGTVIKQRPQKSQRRRPENVV